MNILVLTSIYPQLDDDEKAGITPVVHYFTREWAASANKVMVIHNANKYPKVLYLLPETIIQKINSKFAVVIPKKCQSVDNYSVNDGVIIARFPMLKIFPWGKFFKFQIVNQYKKIDKYLNENNFIPDVVIGHWENPQIPLIAMLKQKYGCRTALVIHIIAYLKKRFYKQWIHQHIKYIDAFGCRSKCLANEVKQLLNLNNDPFICYSGIPDEYIENSYSNTKSFSDCIIKRFIYVGRLIERKNIDCIIKALYKAYPSKKFTLDIIGIGAHENELKRLVDELGLNNQVNFLGRRSRPEVVKAMENNECFTMISRDEAFGLVYLEAMARGCIVVASKDEGIDGIIVEGINGFLCKAGDENELAEIYMKINSMTNEQKEIISRNSIKTANNFKDSDVAQQYLDNILNK